MRAATTLLIAVSVLAILQGCASLAHPRQYAATQESSAGMHRYFGTATSMTEGTVVVEGKTIRYRAVVGRIIVHAPDWHGEGAPDRNGANTAPPEAAMFYVAYLKEDETRDRRPVTFLFNGGPGSSSVWLHMGTFGPRRTVTTDRSPSLAAPFRLVGNEYSLLDASDLVFIDAPGTGFGRIRGKDADTAFYGVDADVHAFARFITEFLSKYDRWNSPKYLIGEGYGASRAAALVNVLETRNNVDFNGIVFLSPVLNSALLGTSGTLDSLNPGLDLSYELALPSFAATAWYYHKLPGPRQPLEPLLERVRRFALTRYARALRQGSLLPRERRAVLAEQMRQYTGLPVSYIEKANLRVDSGEFAHELLGTSGVNTGQLDSRVAGPSLDPLSERAGYDPQYAAVSSAYVSAFNQYVRKTLHYGYALTYNPTISVLGLWNFWHMPPGQTDPVQQWANTMPDLANALKYDPHLEIMVNEGYFDLATPFMEGWYELHQLQIPPKLQANIRYDFYRSGHMAYVPPPVLEKLHDRIAAFIAATDPAQ